jgi:hypothetical protein
MIEKEIFVDIHVISSRVTMFQKGLGFSKHRKSNGNKLLPRFAVFPEQGPKIQSYHLIKVKGDSFSRPTE